MFSIDNWFFEQNLERNVPRDLWYFDSANGITMAVHGWQAERARHRMRAVKLTREGMERLSQDRLYVYTLQDARKVLIFSDRQELRVQDARGFGYAAGSLQEFQYFCRYLRMERHCLYIPKIAHIGQFGGRGFGYWDDPKDLDKVIEYAQGVGTV